MSEDVPTFGRENLPREAEKATWDYWAALYDRGWEPVPWWHGLRLDPPDQFPEPESP